MRTAKEIREVDRIALTNLILSRRGQLSWELHNNGLLEFMDDILDWVLK